MKSPEEAWYIAVRNWQRPETMCHLCTIMKHLARCSLVADHETVFFLSSTIYHCILPQNFSTDVNYSHQIVMGERRLDLQLSLTSSYFHVTAQCCDLDWHGCNNPEKKRQPRLTLLRVWKPSSRFLPLFAGRQQGNFQILWWFSCSE